ncbi:MAG: tetratricopeptide repeat protein [Nitrospira sp.]|nr:tetratricopeptide repeat protein [Nitrospira sp.]
MPPNQKLSATAMEIDRMALQLAKDPQSKVFLPLAEEYCKAGMWQEAAGVLEDGLRFYPGFITAMVVLGRAYDQLGQTTKAKVLLEEAVKLSPENLRAHRTLIKIYVAQGSSGEALRSCEVILALNPRDEEARSIREKLGKSTIPEAGRPLQVRSSSRADRTDAAVPPEPDKVDREETGGPGIPSQDVVVDATTKHEVADHTPVVQDDQVAQERSAAVESSLSAVAPVPVPSPHAATIAQLEAWLRSIERARCDRNGSGRSGSPSSR